MRRSFLNRFFNDDRAAIGPLYAIGITTFVVMGAVGFDYGRLMALDTELQNAADQAALAAVTQLDGGSDAMPRARNAATNTFANAASAFVNETRFAKDTGGGRPITSLSFRFFDGYANDAHGTLLTSDADSDEAKVVEVTVNPRQIRYALTPIVGAVTSGQVIGRALAGLESATCNVAPMMFCLPNLPGGGGVNTNFPTAADIGKGLKLHFKDHGNASPGNGNPNQDTDDGTYTWAPGNFGFLDLDYLPQNGQNSTSGLNNYTLGCSGGAPESDPGFRTPQGTALNTRFDLRGNPNPPNCNSGTGNFCPSENVRHDWVNVQDGGQNVLQANLAGLTCSNTPSNQWEEIENLPTSPQGAGDIVEAAPSQIFSQDNCFLSNSCGNPMLGNATASASNPNWDATTYMARHHSGVPLSTAAPGGTRYEVYKWEIADKPNRLGPVKKIGYEAQRKPNGRYQVDLFCSYPQPVNSAAFPASSTQKDRRIMTVAAVDCTGLTGKDEVKVLRWVDLFLVQPVETTASDRNFFTEIVGPSQLAGGGSGFQFFGRQKAVLIR